MSRYPRHTDAVHKVVLSEISRCFWSRKRAFHGDEVVVADGIYTGTGNTNLSLGGSISNLEDGPRRHQGPAVAAGQPGLSRPVQALRVAFWRRRAGSARKGGNFWEGCADNA